MLVLVAENSTANFSYLHDENYVNVRNQLRKTSLARTTVKVSHKPM